MNKPKFLSVEHASRFKDKNVAELYQYRPSYSDEVTQTLLKLMPENCPRILDAGCGPGKIARGIADDVDHVDAVDFSQEMISMGQLQDKGKHPNIRWICSPIETADIEGPYGLIVTGASLHWMDWDTVLPRFNHLLHRKGYLAIVDGDGPTNMPWNSQRKSLISYYSTNQDYIPFDMVAVLISRNLFEKIGEIQTIPKSITQSIEEFLLSEHSRESLSINGMGVEKRNEFDQKMRNLLESYSVNNHLTYQVSTRIIWGKPLSI